MHTYICMCLQQMPIEDSVKTLALPLSSMLCMHYDRMPRDTGKNSEFSGLINRAKERLQRSKSAGFKEKPKTPVVQKSESDMRWEVCRLIPEVVLN